MLKKLLILSILFPTTAMASDWNQWKWLERITLNHTKVIECMIYIDDNDIISFRTNCSLYVIAHTENKLVSEYKAERAHYPDMDDEQFIEENFAEEGEVIAKLAEQNLLLMNPIKGIIVSLYAAEGLTRNNTVYFKQRNASTIDETSGND